MDAFENGVYPFQANHSWDGGDQPVDETEYPPMFLGDDWTFIGHFSIIPEDIIFPSYSHDIVITGNGRYTGILAN